MSFGDIVEQEAAIKILQDELATDRVNHAYLFTGKEGVGKKTLAFQFVRALLCPEEELDSCENCLSCKKIDHSNHPDVKLLEVEEGSSQIKIDQIRQMQKEIAYRPYESKWKIYIIDQADKMTRQAANSLLKTLEEPPGYAVIILLAEEMSQLLSTVISRCQLIKLYNISREKIKKYLLDRDIEAEKARLFSMLAEGSLGKALTLAEDEEFLTVREEVLSYLIELPEQNTVEIFKQADRMKRLLEDDFPLFNLISGWYRDIIVYMKGDRDKVINCDYLSAIKNLVNKYNVKELISIINLLNDFSGYIDRNVKKDLALQVMLLKIRAKRV